MSSARTRTIVAALGLAVAGCGWQPPVRPAASLPLAPGPAVASPVPTPPASTEPVSQLVTIETRGGECPDGPCVAVVVIEADGRLREVRPNDRILARLPPELLEAIRIEIDQANFPLIESRPFTGICPTAYDGQETIFVFTVGLGTGFERISTCEVAIDPSHTLFRAVAAALAPPTS